MTNVTEAERDAILDAAEAEGKLVAAWIRERLIRTRAVRERLKGSRGRR